MSRARITVPGRGDQRRGVGGEERQQLRVGSGRARRDAVRRGEQPVQQRVRLRQQERLLRGGPDRVDQVVVGVQLVRDDGEEPVQLAQHHRLAERRLGAVLVVDGLPAHPRHRGDLGHRHRRPSRPRR